MRAREALVSTLSLCSLVVAMIVASPTIAADLEAAAKIGRELGRRGNVESDGRPIFGIHSREGIEDFAIHRIDRQTEARRRIGCAQKLRPLQIAGGIIFAEIDVLGRLIDLAAETLDTWQVGCRLDLHGDGFRCRPERPARIEIVRTDPGNAADQCSRQASSSAISAEIPPNATT